MNRVIGEVMSNFSIAIVFQGVVVVEGVVVTQSARVVILASHHSTRHLVTVLWKPIVVTLPSRSKRCKYFLI